MFNTKITNDMSTFALELVGATTMEDKRLTTRSQTKALKDTVVLLLVPYTLMTQLVRRAVPHNDISTLEAAMCKYVSCALFAFAL